MYMTFLICVSTKRVIHRIQFIEIWSILYIYKVRKSTKIHISNQNKITIFFLPYLRFIRIKSIKRIIPHALATKKIIPRYSGNMFILTAIPISSGKSCKTGFFLKTVFFICTIFSHTPNVQDIF